MATVAFYDALRVPLFHGAIANGQVEGCEAILAAFAHHLPGTDPRWVAYALATAFHETAATMQPIEEYGHGRGRAYGHPAGPWHLVYDGRGDVQITWYANYVKATARLRAHGVIGDDVDLARDPELALRPDIAAAIMIFGMSEGWFTGRKFADFFAGTRSDWVDARAIINGHDRAALVAGYALHFYHAFTA